MIGPLHLHQVLTHRGYNPLFGQAILDEPEDVPERETGGAQKDFEGAPEAELNPDRFVRLRPVAHSDEKCAKVLFEQPSTSADIADALGDDTGTFFGVETSHNRAHSDEERGGEIRLPVKPAIELIPQSSSDRHLTHFEFADFVMMGMMLDED